MKKVLALVLAVMLVIGMTPVSFADKYVAGETYLYTLGESYYGGSNEDTIIWPDADGVKLPAPTSRKMRFDIYTNAAGLADTRVTKADVSDSKLSYQIQVTANGRGIKAYGIKYEVINKISYAYLEIEFVDKHVSTGSYDVDFTVYTLYNKVRDLGSAVKVSTKISNYEQTAEEGIDWIYTYDIPVVKSEAYLKSVKVDAGNDVILTAKMFADKKYYARALIDFTTSGVETAILNDYPEIDAVYTLDQVGLSTATVTFDLSDKYYVYNADLEFLGMSNEQLEVTNRYFLSSTELEVDVEDEEPEEDGDVTGPVDNNPTTGGDDVALNANDNPGTGR